MDNTIAKGCTDLIYQNEGANQGVDKLENLASRINEMTIDSQIAVTMDKLSSGHAVANIDIDKIVDIMNGFMERLSQLVE